MVNVKTRIDLWRTYRNEIATNAILHTATRHADERFQVLEKRLLVAYPDYHKRHGSHLVVFQARTENVVMPSTLLLEFDGLERLAQSLALTTSADDATLMAIDNITFADSALDDVVAQVHRGKVNNIEYFAPDQHDSMKITRLQRVNLGRSKMKRLRIAIDGPSGSGKSTVAKIIAQNHHYVYINTGLIYRAIALNALNKGINVSDRQALIDTLVPEMIELLPNEVVRLHGHDVTRALRADHVSQVASQCAAMQEVRSYALMVARKYATVPGTVMDGRDTTFRIMPDADLKIFLDTKPEVRAKRRAEQNRELGFDNDYARILREIVERDQRDRTRAIDPLHQAPGAHLIDASDMKIEEVVATIEALIKKLP